MNRLRIFQGEHTILLLQKKELSPAMAGSFFFFGINTIKKSEYFGKKKYYLHKYFCKKIIRNGLLVFLEKNLFNSMYEKNVYQ